MLVVSASVLSGPSCILFLMMSNLVLTAPLKSRKRSPNENERGFSASPRIVEIQLPLKIASREDLAAWSKYVTNLMASKVNFTLPALKYAPYKKPVHNSAARVKETTRRVSAAGGENRFNYPTPRIEESHVRSSDDKVIAYPLTVGGGQSPTVSRAPSDSFGLSASQINVPLYQQSYLGDFGAANFDFGGAFRQGGNGIVATPDFIVQPPAATYLPLPVRTTNVSEYSIENIAKLPLNAFERRVKNFKEPAKLQTTQNSLSFRIKSVNDNERSSSRIRSESIGRNLSRVIEPLLSFPFQALITLARPEASETTATTSNLPKQPKDHLTAPNRDLPDEFPPYVEKNRKPKNESGRITVVLDDFLVDKIREGAKGNGGEKKENQEEEEKENEEEEEEEEEQDTREGKRGKEEQRKSEKQEKSPKRQSYVLGDLLRMLGILRKLPKNSTEISVAAPVLSILRGTNSQKVQLAPEQTVPNRGRRNETSQTQELNDDDEEEGGGSIQSLLELLPLAAPILEELSDPESDVDLADVLQGAIPLLEGLSDPEEEGGIDFPAVLVPLSQRLSEGPEGQGSDSAAILGPLIQLLAPLIGPILGPLIGPLSRTSSGPNAKEGFASLVMSLAGPLSEPGPDGQSIVSKLIASITASLSKEFAASASGSDVQGLVSSLVSGLLAGTSSGLTKSSSGASKGHNSKDTYGAPTTYGGYGPPSTKDVLSAAAKQFFGSFLKLSGASSASSAEASGKGSSSSAGLSATSSESKEPPKYGPPPSYGVPVYPSYPAPQRPAYSSFAPADAAYATFGRRQAQQKTKQL